MGRASKQRSQQANKQAYKGSPLVHTLHEAHNKQAMAAPAAGLAAAPGRLSPGGGNNTVATAEQAGAGWLRLYLAACAARGSTTGRNRPHLLVCPRQHLLCCIEHWVALSTTHARCYYQHNNPQGSW
jgi:hypothetical protein